MQQAARRGSLKVVQKVVQKVAQKAAQKVVQKAVRKLHAIWWLPE